jgi:hypothetical protein
MQASRGWAWLLGVMLVSLLSWASVAGAQVSFAWGPSAGGPAIVLAGAPNSLETQMLGEQPSPSRSNPQSLLPQAATTLQLHKDSGATLKLPYNLEMNISVLYKREPGATPEAPQRLADNPFFMKYSMDYRVLANLHVGLNAYLYRPAEDSLSVQRPFGQPVMGFGPQLKYDLGRWSFLLKSQMESGSRDQKEGVQNWLRVWYAF